jgi:hypothetical protein
MLGATNIRTAYFKRLLDRNSYMKTTLLQVESLIKTTIETRDFSALLRYVVTCDDDIVRKHALKRN